MFKYFWVFLVVALIVLVAAAYFTGNIPFLNQQSNAPATPSPVIGGQLGSASLGRAVGYGDWGYLVSSVEHLDKITNDSKVLVPGGSYAVVHLTVTNNGKEPRSLSAADFALVDDQGRRYSVESDATSMDSAALGLPNLLSVAVQPGLSKNSVIVFDVPKDARGLTLRLYQGYLDVNLGQ